ncbi:2-hydroxychromene-2-carboxylate isomerase [Cognatilysobacter segetis]|uniref:2-hydroxychromene-2-carboxylate isomerase n=1 Tax=Cognatilysobacter segetis TaxID=2492394 RepID=UPI00105C09EA|nr:2-hydroxychromene-2-carboxylate isomerase [Lysobacter segetis]
MTIRWYFDFISPFAYLQRARIRELARTQAIEYRPILVAGLLQRLEHKGPAEMPDKRRFTYRHVVWRARERGVPLRFPPAHPFNPLAALRLCIAAGCSDAAIDAIFDHLWRDGLRGDDAASLAPVAERLGLDAATAIAAPAVKARLQANFEAAVADGVFGVPTLVADGEVFWGEDATAMFEDWRRDPAAFEQGEMARVAQLPVGVARTPRAG